jgi:2-keto-4-pentenoate hydratase/2-oxohepta-3-ene-1,7-dioic acid hydratase in catechol pathway
MQVQNGLAADWICPLSEMIACLSHVMTLEPGDVVSIGTSGGIGFFRQPQLFMQPGDTGALCIEGIGRLWSRLLALESACGPAGSRGCGVLRGLYPYANNRPVS